MDKLNSISYAYHYKNLDSTVIYARRALAMAGDYGAGKAEAYNNLAFASIMRMDYQDAYRLLDSVRSATDSQIELLIADVQMMRLCQRESRNKEFYDHHEHALHALHRIDEERTTLPERLQRRMVYAESEFHIVTSTYYYYVGLEAPSIASLQEINKEDLEQDTAQYLNYLYQIGAGGIITKGTPREINQQEWDYLMRCYQRSVSSGDIFWQANALQSLSEHLFIKENRDALLADNRPGIVLLNIDDMPDSLLAGNLAQRSLDLFRQYGDVYQIAGGYRTLASCYWDIRDYHSAIACLESALHENEAIFQAPDLVASIRERLSLTYSAIDDKPSSDYNRNAYLDLQEQTRQDRQLEARAEQLNRSVTQLNLMIVAVGVMIALVLFSLFLFDYLRRRNERRELLKRTSRFEKDNEQIISQLKERTEEIGEAQEMNALLLRKNKERNIENRAKIFLVNSITPLIDRMIHEIEKLRKGYESEDIQAERMTYVAELTDKINEYNQVLTDWIQLQQGQLQLRIESFPVQQVLDMVKRSRMSFQLKGIDLVVNDSEAVVKADKILTLFMVNTIADNARKFTDKGGRVAISATEGNGYVEFSVEDTGCGMTEEQLATLFTHQIQGGHGFGLLNCRGIIERYKKISKIFSVCQLRAESRVGEGSRLSFRLPVGIQKLLLAFLLGHASAAVSARPSPLPQSPLAEAVRYADSAYYSNVAGTYERTLLFADSARRYMAASDRQDTSVLIGIANETAVAALALHQWDIYHKNNHIYTQLYKEVSADHSLGAYVRTMQRSEQNKNVAIFLLILLLITIITAYMMLYYRPQLRRRFIAEQRAFARSRDNVEQRQREVELLEDELHRMEYENQQLYVSNNVIDNCLSTLKHETMYYPSRIRQMLPSRTDGTEGPGCEIFGNIAELASYYKELYTLLSQQVMTQVGKPCYDPVVEDYLFGLLRREAGEKGIHVEKEDDTDYIIYKVEMPSVTPRDFFTPSKQNIPYLICRQIVRENSEMTNRRRCGIVAKPQDNGTLMKITLAKIWKNSK